MVEGNAIPRPADLAVGRDGDFTVIAADALFSIFFALVGV